MVDCDCYSCRGGCVYSTVSLAGNCHRQGAQSFTVFGLRRRGGRVFFLFSCRDGQTPSTLNHRPLTKLSRTFFGEECRYGFQASLRVGEHRFAAGPEGVVVGEGCLDPFPIVPDDIGMDQVLMPVNSI
jgi:hypothetical protein